MILFKTLCVSSPGEKCTVCPCIYLFTCRQIQRVSPWYQGWDWGKIYLSHHVGYYLWWFQGSGSKDAQVFTSSTRSQLKCLPGEETLLLKVGMGRMSSTLLICSWECVNLLGQRYTSLPTVRSQAGNKVRTCEGKTAHHWKACQASLPFSIGEPNPSDIFCLVVFFFNFYFFFSVEHVLRKYKAWVSSRNLNYFYQGDLFLRKI